MNLYSELPLLCSQLSNYFDYFDIFSVVAQCRVTEHKCRRGLIRSIVLMCLMTKICACFCIYSVWLWRAVRSNRKVEMKARNAPSYIDAITSTPIKTQSL